MTSDSGSDATVGVVGMGYVGICLAAVVAEHGHDIRGVDVDVERVERIQGGECPIDEDDITGLFERGVTDGRIVVSTDYACLDDCETVLVTVGTPLDGADTAADLSAVEAATESLGPHVDRGDRVIYRSTLPARTTTETVRPLLDEGSGLRAGRDYALAFCPERMAEGNAYEDLHSLPVVVGGLTDECTRSVEAFWEDLGQETVTVSDPTAAELTKLADNWWIDLNIALANEVALLSERLDVDALEVIDAANTLPKGDHHVNILVPGAGVGGSCLVKDPWFIAELGDELGLDLETPRVSRRVNDRMPAHVVDRLSGVADPDGMDVAVLGYAFKTGTDDTRNTPAREVIQRLRDRGASVRVTDPFVPGDVVEAEVGLRPVRLADALDGADAVVVVTGHDQYRSLSATSLIDLVGVEDFPLVDGRHVFDPEEFDGTGVVFRGIGRGGHD